MGTVAIPTPPMGTAITSAPATGTVATQTLVTGAVAEPENEAMLVSVTPIHKKKSWKQNSACLVRDDEKAESSQEQEEEEEELISETETTQSVSLSERDTREDFSHAASPVGRNFAHGSYQWGQNCCFSNNRKSTQICRYFKRGFCSYGEQCSYQHIQEKPLPVGTSDGPMPTASPSRWCSEPGNVPAAVAQGWEGAWCWPAQSVPSVTHVAFELPSVDIEEEDKENISAPDNVPCGTIGGECVPVQSWSASGSQPQMLRLDPNSPDPRKAGVEKATWTDPAHLPMELGAAAAPVPTAVLRARSKAVVCGICMDRVYDKPLPEERLFGILPNCSHAYCVGCIRQWRRGRDFQRTVIKACPECQVTSSYYIPHKYWVSEADEKEKLIETFKARMGKIRCKFFVRSHGHCPFKSDCIYLHELPTSRLPTQMAAAEDAC
ncbi:PREDICTED: probable E3 ubiquitin-protein ligase makorin-1 [Chlamydotis macqueenii]|uniref:probable E3 ubiquitin-protein ligase makorin-1 n=1 Tax=Chlamydotis macqueenii TaxID=187382 RepID=UPI000529C9F7|nr:PREDICTED: probable E3 ubiquitin-protein ligase makorin-1 [Chlamydotis macqueenii]